MNYDGDLKLIPTDDGGDILLQNGQPVMEQGLSTAVYITLFSGDWWANAVSEEAEKLGSELETVFSRTLSNQTRLDAEEYARQALKWMLDSGIAVSIEVEATILAGGTLGLSVRITQPDETVEELRYQVNWANQQINMGAA